LSVHTLMPAETSQCCLAEMITTRASICMGPAVFDCNKRVDSVV
jgi:hypothetical protein